MKKVNTKSITYSAISIAIALILPFITGQIPEVGNMLCPMHIPVMLCGFICGPVYGAITGFISPLLRFGIFGIPPIIPKGIAMAFELATYGFICGFMYRKLMYVHRTDPGTDNKGNKGITRVLTKSKEEALKTLLTAIIAGRMVWGIARYIIAKIFILEFPFSAFIAGAFTTAIPGIILQIILIPLLVRLFEKMKIIIE